MKIDKAVKTDRRRVRAVMGVGLIVLGVAVFASSSSLAQYSSQLLNTSLALLCAVVLLGAIACLETARRTGSSFAASVGQSVRLTMRLILEGRIDEVGVGRRDRGR
jgi:drug/metabolite transporter (DMT)-like permease